MKDIKEFINESLIIEGKIIKSARFKRNKFPENFYDVDEYARKRLADAFRYEFDEVYFSFNKDKVLNDENEIYHYVKSGTDVDGVDTFWQLVCQQFKIDYRILLTHADKDGYEAEYCLFDEIWPYWKKDLVDFLRKNCQ